MSASYVALAVTLPDLEPIYSILDSGSQSAQQTALLEFIADPFDEEYADDLYLEQPIQKLLGFVNHFRGLASCLLQMRRTLLNTCACSDKVISRLLEGRHKGIHVLVQLITLYEPTK